VDESMEWSRAGEGEATRTRRVEVHGSGYRETASINNHVLVLGDEATEGGIYGENKRGELGLLFHLIFSHASRSRTNQDYCIEQRRVCARV
jgi:hypothetical protein